MSSRKTRERQLAKLQARRAAERRRKRRQRIIAGTVAGFMVAGLLAAGGVLLFNRKSKASPNATATKGPTPSAGGVACGGTKPAAADVKKPTFDKPPKLTIDDSKTYTATLQTSCGDIQIELLAKDAPLTVNNFVFLAKQGFYDGLTFHRVVKDFVIQGGDPQGTGAGGPGYQFKDELDNDLTYEPGTVAMANSGPNTNGSQFFIVVSKNGAGQLQKLYTIFGKVTGGMDVVEKIDALPTASQDKPIQTVYIEKVTIQES